MPSPRTAPTFRASTYGATSSRRGEDEPDEPGDVSPTARRCRRCVPVEAAANSRVSFRRAISRMTIIAERVLMRRGG